MLGQYSVWPAGNVVDDPVPGAPEVVAADQFMVSWNVLGVAVSLAVRGEVLEFVLGAAGSRRTGGTTRGAVWHSPVVSSVGSWV